MNKNLKRKWLRALRSGRYKQGKYYLRTDDNTYCCLGVLADCIDNKCWSIADHKGHYAYKDKHGSISNRILSSKIQNELIDLNDGKCNSFTEIADYIKKNIRETEPKAK